MTQKNLNNNLNEKNPLLDECLNKVTGVVEGIKRNILLLYPLLKKNTKPLNYTIKNPNGEGIKIYSEVNMWDKGKSICISTSDNVNPRRVGDYLYFDIYFEKKNTFFNKKRLDNKINYNLEDFKKIKINTQKPINLSENARPTDDINEFLNGSLDSFKRYPEETTFLLNNISKRLLIELDLDQKDKQYQNSLNSLNEISKVNSEIFNKAFYSPDKYKSPEEFKEAFLVLEEGRQKEITNYIYNLKNNENKENKEIKAWLLENFQAFIRK